MAADGMHVVMFPFLAFGHISPFVQLARKLVAAGGVRVTLLSAAANVPRVEAMLGPAAGAVAVAPLRLQRVPGLPEGAESTAEVSADGAELLKVAVDGTRPQVAALLAELRPDALLSDFATPWVTELAAPLGIKALHFSVFSAVSGAYLMVPSRRLGAGGNRPTADDLASAPAGFPPSSSLATIAGFSERTKGKGVVHTGWVQQQHILRHRSVGCFVNHAGLSSVVEGLVAGCRLVLLPMKGDQYLNAALFARDLGVGTEVARCDGDGWFGREDVTDAVDTAMADGWEGQGIHKWRDFLMDDAVQKRLADDFVADFKNFVRD